MIEKSIQQFHDSFKILWPKLLAQDKEGSAKLAEFYKAYATKVLPVLPKKHIGANKPRVIGADEQMAAMAYLFYQLSPTAADCLQLSKNLKAIERLYTKNDEILSTIYSDVTYQVMLQSYSVLMISLLYCSLKMEDGQHYLLRNLTYERFEEASSIIDKIVKDNDINLIAFIEKLNRNAQIVKDLTDYKKYLIKQYSFNEKQLDAKNITAPMQQLKMVMALIDTAQNESLSFEEREKLLKQELVRKQHLFTQHTTPIAMRFFINLLKLLHLDKRLLGDDPLRDRGFFGRSRGGRYYEALGTILSLPARDASMALEIELLSRVSSSTIIPISG